MTKNSDCVVFEYLYRDASNYKAWGALLLTGDWTEEDTLCLVRCLDSKELFVAEQVGIPVLHAELYQYSGGMTVDDHAFHEFSSIRPATADDMKSMAPWGSAKKLLDAFGAVKGHWDVTLSPHCDGWYGWHR